MQALADLGGDVLAPQIGLGGVASEGDQRELGVVDLDAEGEVCGVVVL